MKKLLIIGYVWPEPASSAAGSRMMELIHAFIGDQWHITFASAAVLSEHRADLISLGVNEQTIALNDASFNQFIDELQPHAVLFDRFFTEEQFGWRVEQVCPNALRLLDTEDLHSLRNVRQQLLKKSQSVCATEIERNNVDPVMESAAALYKLMADDAMAQREVAAIFRCDLSLMISHYEINLLTEYFSVPTNLLHYCPFLNLAIREPELLPSFAARQHFISIGNFRHEPNWDAVLYLKHAIWPLIRSQLPKAELHIYGAYPPPKATQLTNVKQGFLVKGWAANALEVMKNARVCLAPLRFGAGIKGKLIDAMQTATPSVTTAIGAESMQSDLSWGGAVENSTEAFVAAAIRLYSDEQSWLTAQQQGAQVLKAYCGQANHTQVLLARVNELQKNVLQERQQNFVGAMLRHHLHKSTQYMSQWIEAKNQQIKT